MIRFEFLRHFQEEFEFGIGHNHLSFGTESLNEKSERLRAFLSESLGQEVVEKH